MKLSKSPALALGVLWRFRITVNHVGAAVMAIAFDAAMARPCPDPVSLVL
ncbi:hypothetical protein [Leptolyngbya iicbica]|uniref:Uncharacterized protein n=1 Tax=Lyngbya confervoides BDU141951 TaxID=1574623 RepID=A0A8T6QUX3_9CYAN|nr:hypothetical protein [Leptolyngbya sp. LK]